MRSLIMHQPLQFRLKLKLDVVPICLQGTIWNKQKLKTIVYTPTQKRRKKTPHVYIAITYGGTVLRTYIIEFIPVIRIASRPTHPACSNTNGA